MPKPRRIYAMLVAALLLSLPAAAAPVADTERAPLDLRRTTLIVRDMETSLRFYRDALKMAVAYDQVIRTPRDATSDEAATRSLRLVLLRANDDFIGMIGLIQYYKPQKPLPAAPLEPFSIGSMVFVFNATNARELFAEARRLPGVRVIEEPTPTSYPGYGGAGTIPVIVSVLTDPDGYVVELNELLATPGRQQPADDQSSPPKR